MSMRYQCPFVNVIIAVNPLSGLVVDLSTIAAHTRSGRERQPRFQNLFFNIAQVIMVFYLLLYGANIDILKLLEGGGTIDLACCWTSDNVYFNSKNSK